MASKQDLEKLKLEANFRAKKFREKELKMKTCWLNYKVSQKKPKETQQNPLLRPKKRLFYRQNNNSKSRNRMKNFKGSRKNSKIRVNCLNKKSNCRKK